jgi:hypothetical protein
MSATKLKNEIGVLLSDKPMSLPELAEAMGVKEKKAYNLLKGMFTEERINGFKDEDGVRRYRCTEEEAEAAAKRKAKAEKKAEK